MAKWKEIQNSFLDEYEQNICIDAWKSNNAGEEGKVIAKISISTQEVVYLDKTAKTDPHAQKVIMETIQNIKNNEYTGR